MTHFIIIIVINVIATLQCDEGQKFSKELVKETEELGYRFYHILCRLRQIDTTDRNSLDSKYHLIRHCSLAASPFIVKTLVKVFVVLLVVNKNKNCEDVII